MKKASALSLCSPSESSSSSSGAAAAAAPASRLDRALFDSPGSAQMHTVFMCGGRACVCIGERGKRWVSGPPVVGAVWLRHALCDVCLWGVCLFVCTLGLICQCRTITQQCACVDERAADGASTFLGTCCPSRTTTASLHRGRYLN